MNFSRYHTGFPRYSLRCSEKSFYLEKQPFTIMKLHKYITHYTTRGTLVAIVLGVIGAETFAAPDRKPNILIIVADDMGYSDLACFGGEIKTPHLDALAKRGMRATNFYASPTCSPTRSMLLTGTDNHVAGLGNMAEWLGPNQKGKPGYEGHLNDRVVTIASMLRKADYHTYMAGKWHLGEEPEGWPAAHGFERDLSILDGAGSHWGDMQGLNPAHPKLTVTRNGKKIAKLPEGYFSTKDFTDFIQGSVEENRKDGKPFFAYLAYQVPHGPLASPGAWRDKYKGVYDSGYDEIRKMRLARQKELGLVGAQVVGFPRLPNIPAWDSLTARQRLEQSRKMELYASMVENMDHHIGRLLKYLDSIGELDNTLIIFFSDNGAAGEDIGELVKQLAPQAKDWFDQTFDNKFENWGQPGSCVDYGPAWAQVGMVPFRQFKGVLAEGGIRASLIVAGAGVEQISKPNHSLLHVMDIVPTVLDVTGVKHPSMASKGQIKPVQGKSMLPILGGKSEAIRKDGDWLGWELFGNRAVRQGDWKALYLLEGAGGSGEWQLFNLLKDPGELHDLSKKNPLRLKTLTELWASYAKSNGVVISDAGPFAKSKTK
jgi:arylsulfatase A-like enzyme